MVLLPGFFYFEETNYYNHASIFLKLLDEFRIHWIDSELQWQNANDQEVAHIHLNPSKQSVVVSFAREKIEIECILEQPNGGSDSAKFDLEEQIPGELDSVAVDPIQSELRIGFIKNQIIEIFNILENE